MRRASLQSLASLAAVAVLLWAAPAAGQDMPSISAEMVGPGEGVTFVVSGSGWADVAGPIFVLSCPDAEGDLATTTEDDCDTTNIFPATPDADGNFEVEVTFDIPEEGLVVIASDATQAASAGIVVGIAAEEPPPAEEAPPEEEPLEEAAEEVVEEVVDELAETGSETGLFAIIAAAAVVAGLMVFALARKARRAS